MVASESAADPLALLAQLEQRALADPRLAAEWQEAWAVFAGADRSPETAARFREWFLLERPAAAFGSAPVQYWAPQSFDPEGAWARLLDSFLGIFRRIGGDDRNAVLEDLWSRRVVASDAPALAELDADSLAVGRFVLDREERHAPLPGLFVLRAPGLAAALEQDFARIRVQQPRSRLGQGEIERLFAPFFPRSQPPGRGALEAALAQALAGEPDWSLARLRALVAEAGAGEALNQLAFETGADLEALRRLLPEYARALAAEAEAEEEGSTAAVEKQIFDPAAALARFDAGRMAGKSLDELFRGLEEDLGLEPDSTLEGDPRATVARVEVPADFATLLETYAWERGQEGRPLVPGERAQLAAWADFLRALMPGGVDLRQLRAPAVLGFLLRTEQADAAAALAALLPFLTWAVREQEAPLEDLLAELHGGLGRRVPALQACNAALAAAPKPARARLVASDPPQVRDERERPVAVRGLPAAYARLPQIGDWVLFLFLPFSFFSFSLLPSAALAPAAGSEDQYFSEYGSGG